MHGIWYLLTINYQTIILYYNPREERIRVTTTIIII